MRYKIAMRNLLISQAIIIIFLIFAYFAWFPHSFIELGGFKKTAFMLVFADLILGPLLVFIIYKKDKKYLTFDINILLAIQIGAFIFGAYSLYLKHPAYAVFSVDRFVLTNVSDIYPYPTWRKKLQSHFFSSPKLVLAEAPKDPKERIILTIDVVLNGEPGIQRRPKYFSPLSKHTNSVWEKGIQIKLLALDKQAKEKMKLFTDKYQGEYDDFAFFPLKGNNKKNVIWVFDKKTTKPIDIIDIDPWKFKIASNISIK